MYRIIIYKYIFIIGMNRRSVGAKYQGRRRLNIKKYIKTNNKN